MPEFIGALDQGTTSTRFLIFDHHGVEVGRSQLAQRQIFPRPGWVEQDAAEIWQHSLAVISAGLATAGLSTLDLAGVGIANQRETTIIWDKRTGEAIGPAISWQDTRTEPVVAAIARSDASEAIRLRTGLPISTYPSATKLAWQLDNVDGVRERAARGDLAFGTVESWLAWKLSGVHVTDVTNASRTMLMDLATLDWDDELLDRFQIPRQLLGEIHASTFEVGELDATYPGGRFAVTGMLGDQQAALVGHRCLLPNDAKNTYGTGSFLLVNTGTRPITSTNGLIATVAYQLLGDRPRFALEGAVAMVGAAVQWLRDELGVASSLEEIEGLASSVPDTAGAYFVPAFAGLFAPYWRGDVRGTILGLSRAHTRAHLSRAVLEAIGFQSLDVVAAIEADLGEAVGELRVDGGVTANALCMQLQADILGVPVVRDGVTEATALGAAYAAGLGAGFWRATDDLPVPPGQDARRFLPSWSEDQRLSRIDRWRQAVQLSLEWADGESPS